MPLPKKNQNYFHIKLQIFHDLVTEKSVWDGKQGTV